jgi:hypothetical protein
MTTQAQAQAIAFINPAPTAGHVQLRNDRGELIDGFAGPRDFMIRVGLRSGFRVVDELGREVREV